MKELKIERVEDCARWLEDGEAFTHSQSVSFLIDKLGELSISLAFINNQSAIAKQRLNLKKVDAYHTLLASNIANETYFAPSLAKDYIASKCDQEQYDYDLCERTSRTLVHFIDAIRTAISALKMEMQVSNYSNAA